MTHASLFKVTFSSTMSACEKQWQQTLSIWKALGQVKVEPNVFSFSVTLHIADIVGQHWWSAFFACHSAFFVLKCWFFDRPPAMVGLVIPVEKPKSSNCYTAQTTATRRKTWNSVAAQPGWHFRPMVRLQSVGRSRKAPKCLMKIMKAHQSSNFLVTMLLWLNLTKL